MSSSSPPDTVPKRVPVPLLLDSFPAPPTHIPPTPTSPNPPPTGPPSLPLPPVPGPSRISEHEQLLLLSSIARRNSRYSVHSPNRVSYASLDSSGGKSPPISLSPLPAHNRDSLSSSYSSTSPPPPRRRILHDIDDNHSRKRSFHHSHNESISEIDVNDILAAVVDHDDVVPENIPLTPSRTATHTASHVHHASTDPANSTTILAAASRRPAVTPKDIHHELRAARSSSANHKASLRARSRSRPPSPAMTIDELESEIYKPSIPPPLPRPASPDIDTILSTTPRPLRSSQSRSRLRSAGLDRRKIASDTFTTDSFLAHDPRRRQSEGLPRDSDLPYLQRQPSVISDRHVTRDPAVDSDSDSSIDLHTPLPHLMVRHGLLSPHSKLLPQADSRAATPLAADGRPGSTLSLRSNAASVMTKSGIIKDERDTPSRRNRHRDNRLLRGGIGLTTGLGWSDSEDEDAPSPLTRRISSLNLSRRSSSASVWTTSSSSHQYRPHPLSRSYSSGALLESDREALHQADFDESDKEDHTLKESGEWAQRQRQTGTSRFNGRSSLPPTSWQRKPASTSGTRTSTSSVGSGFSLETSASSRRVGGGGGAGSGRESNGSSFEHQTTPPSTSSTLSIPMPVTPQDLDSTSVTTSKHGRFDKDKSLPPLPAGGLKKPSSRSSTQTTTPQSGGLVRPRTYSSASSSIASASTPAPPTPTSPKVRPLQLTRQRPSRISADRPAVPVPAIPMSTLNHSASQSSLRLPSVSKLSLSTSAVPTPTNLTFPSSPVNGNAPTTPARPKPRTGTGMTYRTSSYSSASTNKARPAVSAMASTPGTPTSARGNRF